MFNEHRFETFAIPKTGQQYSNCESHKLSFGYLCKTEAVKLFAFKMKIFGFQASLKRLNFAIKKFRENQSRMRLMNGFGSRSFGGGKARN